MCRDRVGKLLHPFLCEKLVIHPIVLGCFVTPARRIQSFEEDIELPDATWESRSGCLRLVRLPFQFFEILFVEISCDSSSIGFFAFFRIFGVRGTRLGRLLARSFAAGGGARTSRRGLA